MGKVDLNPYLFFDGQCKEAMEFYKDVFGGELKIQTMGEVPEEIRQQSGNPAPDRVMHAKLSAKTITIMGSDSPKSSPKAAKIELSLTGDDEAEMKKIFDGLGQGGEVTMSLSKQFWNDTFGMLSDKYGIDWMVNITDAA
jgi:PhnB protein